MLIILFFFLLYSILYYKRAVLITASTLLFLPNLGVGVGDIKLLYIVCVFQIFLFLKKRIFHKEQYMTYSGWLLIPMILASLGYIVSNFIGEEKNLPIIIVNILCYFVYPYIVWCIIDEKKWIIFYLKIFLFFFLIVGCYALVELALGQNVYIIWATDHNIISGILGGLESGERFGLLRCNSILPYSSTLGMLSAFTFFILLYLRSLKIIVYKKIDIIILLLAPFCVLLSGTRSQFIVLAILFIPFILWGDYWKTKWSKIFIFGLVILMIVFNDYFMTIIDSIIYSDKNEMGSSSDMRLDQLAICQFYVDKSPWFGHGKNYIWDQVRPYNPGLLGAESVWFQLMVDYGYVGCITYILVCIGAFMFVKRYSLVLCFIPIAFIVGKTLSIVIGMELSFMLIICIIMVKITIYCNEVNRYS